MLIKSRKVETMIEMLKCRKKLNNNKIKHFYSAAPKNIIWRLRFSLIGAMAAYSIFFVWSPVWREPQIIKFKNAFHIWINIGLGVTPVGDVGVLTPTLFLVRGFNTRTFSKVFPQFCTNSLQQVENHWSRVINSNTANLFSEHYFYMLPIKFD